MLAVAWVGALTQWVASHFNFALSVACGLAALGASIYSIKANRAKQRFYDAERETLEKKP